MVDIRDAALQSDGVDLKRWNDARYSAFARRLFAVHEAGHVIAARHYSIHSMALIFLGADGWKGFATMPRQNKMPREARRVIGIAGAAAEMLWLGIPQHRFYQVSFRVSGSDWKMIDDTKPSTPLQYLHELGIATKILQSNESQWLSLSRRLIVESRHHTSEKLTWQKRFTPE